MAGPSDDAHWSMPDPARRKAPKLNPPCLCRSVPHAQQPHHALREPADGDARPLALQQHLNEIGRKEPDTAGAARCIDLRRRLAAEALGTGLLVATVVGSGIMADRLTGDVAIALLGNTLPTGAILVVLITILGRFPARISTRP